MKKNATLTFIFFTFLLKISINPCYGQSVPNYVPIQGLIGFWGFNGNSGDSSGNGRHALVLGASLTTDRFGTSNGAYFFDGVNDVISVPSGTNNIGSILDSELTISVWAQNQSFPSSYAPLVSKLGSANSGRQFQFYYSPTTMSFRYHSSNWNTPNLHNSFWNHYVVIFNRGLLKFYKNGVMLDSIVGGLQTLPNSSISALEFGADTPEFPDYFFGKLDDIGIWNRALNPNEVISLFTLCTSNIQRQPTSINFRIPFLTSTPQAIFCASSISSISTFRWQVLSGNTFVNLTNAGPYNGAYDDTLFVNVFPNLYSQIFRCVVTTHNCVEYTNPAMLSVCGLNTRSPENDTVVLGGNATFVSKTSDPLARYRWQRDSGTGFESLINNSTFSGVYSDSLTVFGVNQLNNHEKFRCITETGQCVDTSVSATLVVLASTGQAEDDLIHEKIEVFPNPVKQVLFVKGAKLGNTKYNIFDKTGRLVKEAKLDESSSISVIDLAEGMYFLSFSNSSSVLKILVQF